MPPSLQLYLQKGPDKRSMKVKMFKAKGRKMQSNKWLPQEVVKYSSRIPTGVKVLRVWMEPIESKHERGCDFPEGIKE